MSILSGFRSCSLILFLIMLGCSNGNAPDIESEEEEHHGVSVVTNTGENVWADHDTAPLQFELEQTFGVAEEPEEEMLANVRGAVVDEEGVVYVLDSGNNRIVAFNSDGSIRWSEGREGEGPGEFQNAYRMAGNDKHLYVSNQMNARVDVWKTDGTFVESHDVSELGVRGGIEGYAQGKIILGSPSFGDEPPEVHIVDKETWELERSFDLDLDFELPERASYLATLDVRDDHFWTNNLYSYDLSRYELDGELTRRIVREDDDYLVGVGMYEGNTRSFSGLSSPVRLGDYELVASWWSDVDNANAATRRFVEDNAEAPINHSAIDLFDPKGRFQGTLQWEDARHPGIGHPLTVGPDSKLYTMTDDPFPQVRRYKVDINL